MKHYIKQKLRESLFGDIDDDIKESNIFYHSISGKQTLDIKDRIKNVITNGLIPHDPHEDGYTERGVVIWLSPNYDDFAKKGNFVVSLTDNIDNREKYDIRFDGQYGVATNQIPFNVLTVVKIPIIISNTFITNNINIIKLINNGIDVTNIANVIDNKKGQLLYDMFMTYVQPYLKNKNFINELVKILDEDKITSIL